MAKKKEVLHDSPVPAAQDVTPKPKRSHHKKKPTPPTPVEVESSLSEASVQGIQGVPGPYKWTDSDSDEEGETAPAEWHVILKVGDGPSTKNSKRDPPRSTEIACIWRDDSGDIVRDTHRGALYNTLDVLPAILADERERWPENYSQVSTILLKYQEYEWLVPLEYNDASDSWTAHLNHLRNGLITP